MSEELRTAVLEGLRAFAEEEPDFAMSHGMRARAADFILAQPRPAPKADGLVEELQKFFREWFPEWDGDQSDAIAEALSARLAALKDRDVVLEEAAERAAFVAGYRAAHMVPDAYDSTSAAEEAWEGYRLVSRALKERV